MTRDLAAKNPAKLQEMQALFTQEAVKNSVLPDSQTFYAGMTGMSENTFINIKNRSFSITADVDLPASANGVILCQAGKFGGWSLYMRDGRLKFAYNYLGLKEFTVASAQPLPVGKAQRQKSGRRTSGRNRRIFLLGR